MCGAGKHHSPGAVLVPSIRQSVLNVDMDVSTDGRMYGTRTVVLPAPHNSQSFTLHLKPTTPERQSVLTLRSRQY
jgi:hypothetical protein